MDPAKTEKYMTTPRKRKRSTSEDGNLSPFFHDEDFIHLETNYPEIMETPNPSSQEPDSKTSIGMQTASDSVESSKLTITTTGCTSTSRTCVTTRQATLSDTVSPSTVSGPSTTAAKPSAEGTKNAETKVEFILNELPEPSKSQHFTAHQLATKIITVMPQIEPFELQKTFIQAFRTRIRRRNYESFIHDFKAALLRFYIERINLFDAFENILQSAQPK
ncbi:MAG: hypothetical protein GY696_24380, partial [Gammaproteobacteria bacterium]|nr:hypothetical protein [Gammaproteobacteria bacterium]